MAEENTTAREPTPSREPDVRGTLFLTLVFLAMIFGFWALLYYMLLNR
ncbi:cytochrome c oxidase subunit 2A [Rhodocaloribacter litoris]|nr:cytochrome c oxidase subunit 2A [Rhodocaloribacter litoris]QXD14286.1 cytochrome c oxidase subunit 2A [Rhodocaloribacter litoris]